MKLSVIIPCYNERDTIGTIVDVVKAAPYPNKEILIVDEALAVGDAIFANRCIKKFEELKQRKITVLFVSHDLGLAACFSEQAR